MRGWRWRDEDVRLCRIPTGELAARWHLMGKHAIDFCMEQGDVLAWYAWRFADHWENVQGIQRCVDLGAGEKAGLSIQYTFIDF